MTSIFIPNQNDITTKKKLNLTRKQWLKNYDINYYYNHVNDYNNNILTDHILRAKILLHHVLLYKVNKICLLDGHGRFLYQIIYLTQNDQIYKKLKNIKIYICETNKYSHRFHKLNFPKDIYSIKMDIFKYAQWYNDSNCIFYYNFCSLGKDCNNIIKNIINEINKKHKLMITFHVRKNESLYKFANLLEVLSQGNYINRGNTKTWFIPRQTNYIKLKEFF